MPGRSRTAWTAWANRGTQSVSRRTWSTMQIRLSPRCRATRTFSATVLLPSENSEWMWKSSVRDTGADSPAGTAIGAARPVQVFWPA
jgi:hypothetical protein